MPVSALHGGRVPIELWAPFEAVSDELLGTLRNAAKLPWVFHHLAAAPAGRVTATAGSSMPGAIPLGDLGDGAVVQETSLSRKDLPTDLHDFVQAVSVKAPRRRASMVRTAWPDDGLRRDVRGLLAEGETLTAPLNLEDARAQLGTTSAGFLCLYLDGRDRVWVGLRIWGSLVGRTVQELYVERARSAAYNDHLPSSELAVLVAGSEALREYLRDASWAQRYAALNRRVALLYVLEALVRLLPRCTATAPALYATYGSVAPEEHFDSSVMVSRAGAARVAAGEQVVLLPRCGGRGCVARGRGAEISFQSAFSDVEAALQGDLAEVTTELRPLLVVRG